MLYFEHLDMYFLLTEKIDIMTLHRLKNRAAFDLNRGIYKSLHISLYYLSIPSMDDKCNKFANKCHFVCQYFINYVSFLVKMHF